MQNNQCRRFAFDEIHYSTATASIKLKNISIYARFSVDRVSRASRTGDRQHRSVVGRVHKDRTEQDRPEGGRRPGARHKAVAGHRSRANPRERVPRDRQLRVRSAVHGAGDQQRRRAFSVVHDEVRFDPGSVHVGAHVGHAAQERKSLYTSFSVVH